MPRLGAHLSIAGGLPRAVDRARASRCDALQIFTKSATQWHARLLPAAEIREFRRRVRDRGIRPVVAHASYLINLAASGTLRARSVAALTEELERAEALGLMGLVLHPGAATDTTVSDGLRRVADALTEVLTVRPRGRVRILLEHTAGQGRGLGHRFEHLAAIIDRTAPCRRLGVCLDTCHLLAAGYDLTSDDGYDATLAEFDAIVGLQRLTLLHLNDSARPRGSRVDRHAHIGRGFVGIEGFRRVVTDSRLAHLPMLIETPKSAGRVGRPGDVDPWDRRNLGVLRRLMGRGAAGLAR